MGARVLTAIVLLTAGMGSPALAEGDPERGRELYRPCAACHMIGDGAINRIGPHLNGIVGRPAGVAMDYRYSEALIDAASEGLVWTAAELDRFLAEPNDYIAGLRMVFRGIHNEQDRDDLIAYLRAEGGTPDPVFANATAVLLAPSDEVLGILRIQGDAYYGEYLSAECTACHRPEGGDDIPSIAGLAPLDFIDGLVAYRSGERDHQVMQTITARLGDEEIAALAAYFEAAN
ncbi:Sulfite dehydrogenase cytochrome subunit SoxD [Roseibacterium elongatum DSM 19469]|uniref:Sulfite dehydrogenase cytochrome subunit SoxD n=1 Tax=Roseicyclus elongatus DSM 19469 TaxID=1294273 RepID=W8S6R7_9RHOB|nr:c-type cytochrome [Roseibacterium elongatum]AHM04591.1 Sulfite dehydrogenase cytochrome subunit SoxD [Roseibacterium elongatum DSM 19469]